MYEILILLVLETVDFRLKIVLLLLYTKIKSTTKFVKNKRRLQGGGQKNYSGFFFFFFLSAWFHQCTLKNRTMFFICVFFY